MMSQRKLKKISMGFVVTTSFKTTLNDDKMFNMFVAIFKIFPPIPRNVTSLKYDFN